MGGYNWEWMEFTTWYYWVWMFLYCRDKCLLIEDKPAAGTYTLGKHPPFHPSPKHPLDTTTLEFNNSLSERSGIHTLPAPQKGPVKASYLCQLLDVVSCFLTSVYCTLFLSLLPQGHRLSKNQPHFHLEPKQVESIAGWARKSHHKPQCLTYFPRCKSRKRHIITLIKILSYM